MNKQSAKKMLLDNANACYNAVKENGWQSKLLKESIDHIIDKLEPDHPKVKLPREVGEELDTWIANNQDGYGGRISDLCGSLWDEIQELPATATFANKSEENYFKVIDAYRYGWKAEPEELFYVKAPENWVGDGLSHFTYMCKSRTDTGIDRTNAYKNNPYAQFTRAELKKYHLDSDIFTLVPVGAEK